MTELLLLSTWLVPLALGLGQAFRPQHDRWILMGAAIGAALPALLTALFVPVPTIAPFPALLLGSTFALDVPGQAFLLFTAVLWLLAGVFASAYLSQDAGRPRFFAFFLLALAGNVGLIVAYDLASFYLLFALMSFASYGLIVHSGEPKAIRAGNVYIVLVVIGEILLFAALALIYAETGTLRVDELAAAGISSLSAALIFVSFGIKAGVVLLHLWLPLAHPAAPVPASAVLSGAMIKAGVIGWLRFLHPDAAADWGSLLIAIGVITAFYGAVVGVVQVNAKTVLAYSSISQMGLITIGVGTLLLSPDRADAALTAVVLYAFHHGLAKGALFLGVAFAGVSRWVPALLLIPALALAGLPLTSGAIAKGGLKSVTGYLAEPWHGWLDILLPLAAVGTTLLMARYLWLIVHAGPQHKPHPPHLWVAWLSLIVLSAGVMFAWPTAAAALTYSLGESALWPSIWPLLVGTGLALLVIVTRRRQPHPLIPPGDLLEGLTWIMVKLRPITHSVRKGLGAADQRLGAIVGYLGHAREISTTAHAAETALRAGWLWAGGALLLIAVIVLVSAIALVGA